MAEEKKKQEFQEKKHEKKIVARRKEEVREESLIRILSTDIPGNKNVYSGLTRIKGISWNFSNAICSILGINKNKKIQELTPGEIEKISEFIRNPKLPEFILNRRKDLDDGKNKHLFGADLDLQKEFDIKRMKKIRSYKGVRHMTGQPVRGQRTKSHFRTGTSLGVKKGKMKSSGK